MHYCSSFLTIKKISKYSPTGIILLIDLWSYSKKWVTEFTETTWALGLNAHANVLI